MYMASISLQWGYGQDIPFPSKILAFFLCGMFHLSSPYGAQSSAGIVAAGLFLLAQRKKKQRASAFKAPLPEPKEELGQADSEEKLSSGAPGDEETGLPVIAEGAESPLEVEGPDLGPNGPTALQDDGAGPLANAPDVGPTSGLPTGATAGATAAAVLTAAEVNAFALDLDGEGDGDVIVGEGDGAALPSDTVGGGQVESLSESVRQEEQQDDKRMGQAVVAAPLVPGEAADKEAPVAGLAPPQVPAVVDEAPSDGGTPEVAAHPLHLDESSGLGERGASGEGEVTAMVPEEPVRAPLTAPEINGAAVERTAATAAATAGAIAAEASPANGSPLLGHSEVEIAAESPHASIPAPAQATTEASQQAVVPDNAPWVPIPSPLSGPTTFDTAIEYGPHTISNSDITFYQLIGSGPFGDVYLALWMDRLVAAKVLLKTDRPQSVDQRQQSQGQMSMSPSSSGSFIRRGASSSSLATPMSPKSPTSPSGRGSLLARLKQEAGLLASLRHPNIVDFMGVCMTPPGCILTEYCEKGSVRDVLAHAQGGGAAAQELTWERRLAMALDAAQGMKYLHGRSQPVVHRDLKSPNLRVDGSWRVKVADFNLSRLLTAGQRSMAIAASPHWLAPEVLRGGGSGPPADVFAFGVILWELLTWEKPWKGVQPLAIIDAVLAGARLPIPSEADLPGPAGLPDVARYVALIERCWAQEPAHRPSFAVVVRELQAQFEAGRGNVTMLQRLQTGVKSAIEPIRKQWRN